MKDIDEIKKDPRLRNILSDSEGFKADIHIGGWDGSFILSYGAGWEHASVRPYVKRIIPSWYDMCKIKDMIWNEDEAVIQIHPPKADYVNLLENCLHLWRCTYKEMILPPRILVGPIEGMTPAQFKQEVKEAYEIAGELEKEPNCLEIPKGSMDYISKQEVVGLMMHIWGKNFSGDDAMQECIDAIRVMPSVTPQEPVLDKLRAEIEQTTSRYSISRERGGMGQVEWSDNLIKESEVLKIIDKYKAESEG